MIRTFTNGLRATFFCVLVIFLSQSALGQSKGSIQGKVRDKETGEPLPGATIAQKGTSYGVTTDVYGDYFLILPPGDHTLEVRFIGFTTITREVTITAGGFDLIDFEMEPSALLGSEVVITGQLLGQQAAINQQINSNTIVNVVSKDKIQELPDQNAAESVGRLPGIAIQRDGGEGQKVVVRGLSPRFNNITINGERIPSTDPQDRSVDLSLIAPEQLEGIEVFKALTPDMDADAVGGTVNFIAKKADEGLNGRIRGSTGYNSLVDEYGQGRLNGNISNRFFDNKLGVLLTGNYQRANRSSEDLSADYDTFGDALDIGLTSARARATEEIRKRFGSSLTLDYDFKNGGQIMLNTNWSQTDREITRKTHSINIDDNTERFDWRDEFRSTSTITNTLSGSHSVFNSWRLDWKTSYARTRQETPFRNELRFRLNGAFPSESIGFNNSPPAQFFNAFEPFFDENVELATLQRGQVRAFEQETQEDIYTARLDLNKDITIGSEVSGKLRFGGKIRVFDRANDVQNYRDNGNGPSSGLADFAEAFPNEYELEGINILAGQFVDNQPIENFLDGEVTFGPSIDNNEARRFFDLFGSTVLNRRDILDGSVGNADYEATEIISAGYAMGEFNIGKVMLLGGARVERTDGEYVGFETLTQDDENTEEGEEVDVLVNRRINDVYYVDLLPMFHVRYRATEWFDVRMAVTKTLSRPDFQNWVPWQNIDNANQTVRRGNPNLRNALAWNYDLFLSFYNRLGLFTIGGFYKEIENIDVLFTRRIVSGQEFRGFTVEEPIFIEEPATVKGIEIDFQTNLKSLPSPFDGIVFSANATFIDTEILYPVFDIGDEFREPELFNPNPQNTFRQGSIIGQPSFTTNLSLGYEKGGFSGRVSVLIQDDTFDQLGSQELRDEFVAIFDRWDATLSQKINKQFSVFLNWNNITNEPERNFIADGSNESFRELYGATVDLGLSYKFSN